MNPWIFFKVKWFLFKEGRAVRRHFPSFLPYEKAIERAYRGLNPFQLCKAQLKKQGEAIIDGYGETPLPALAIIAQECGLNQDDFLIELGCGRGRGCFFLHHLLGCRVLGIDWVPFFIETANQLGRALSSQVSFQCVPMQTADLRTATVIYLYGTCLSDPLIHTLIDRFKVLPPSTKIITVSYPLSDYSSDFYTHKQWQIELPWGQAEVFLNYKIPFISARRRA